MRLIDTVLHENQQLTENKNSIKGLVILTKLNPTPQRQSAQQRHIYIN